MNSQIPSNPEITAQMQADGAQQLPSGEQPIQQAPVDSDVDTSGADFWGDLSEFSDEIVEPVVEQQPAANLSNEPVPQQPVAPEPQQLVAQPQAPQPSPEVTELRQQIQSLTTNIESMRQQVPQQSIPQDQLVQNAINQLAGTAYAMSPQQVDQFISEPEKILPVMAAQLHVNLVQQMSQMIQQSLPQQVGDIINRQIAAQRIEGEFYGKYPGLRNSQFSKVVNDSIRLVKELNPQANRQQVMDLAASAAAQTLRQAGYGDVLQPQAAVQQNLRNTPYSPAAASHTPAQHNVPQKPVTIWQAMAEDGDF